MKFILPLVALFGLVSISSAQSISKLQAAVAACVPSNFIPLPSIAAVAGGLVDANCNVVATAKSGLLANAAGARFLALRGTVVLTPGTTVSFAPGATIATGQLTPAQNATINAVTTGLLLNELYRIEVITSGTSSFTLTFGSNFKSTATLATGTADAKTFVVTFFWDGVNLVEQSRTAAQ